MAPSPALLITNDDGNGSEGAIQALLACSSDSGGSDGQQGALQH